MTTDVNNTNNEKQKCYDNRGDEIEIEKEQMLLSQPPSPLCYRKR